jgi:hypothetical protein
MEEAGVRALPRVKYGNREYFVDERLCQFRSVSYPPEHIEFVPFDSSKGRKIKLVYLFERSSVLRQLQAAGLADPRS